MSYRSIPVGGEELKKYLRDLSDSVYRLNNGGAIKGNVSFGPSIRIGDVQMNVAHGSVDTDRTVTFVNLIDGSTVYYPIQLGTVAPASVPARDGLLYLDTAALVLYFSMAGVWAVAISTPRMVTGSVDASGNVVSGNGFNSTRTGTGAATIAFTPPFAVVPTVTVTAQGALGATRLAEIISGSKTTSGFNVQTVAGGGAVADAPFDFVAFTTL